MRHAVQQAHRQQHVIWQQVIIKEHHTASEEQRQGLRTFTTAYDLLP